MKVIYRNQVKGIGSCVGEFKGAGMFIIFGDNAPDEIKDYCYTVDVVPLNGTIRAGQYLILDDQAFEITSIGVEAPVTLEGLGHMTISFTGLKEPEMMGTCYVKLPEGMAEPELGLASMILIVEV